MIMQFLCRRDTKVSLYHMKNVELTFNDLPQVVAELRDEVIGMKVALLDLQKSQTKQKLERVRCTMNVEEAADYLRMPLNTLYMKLQKGEVPGSKPGKRWVLFNDELDKWLEVKRKNAVPLTTEWLQWPQCIRLLRWPQCMCIQHLHWLQYIQRLQCLQCVCCLQ